MKYSLGLAAFLMGACLSATAQPADAPAAGTVPLAAVDPGAASPAPAADLPVTAPAAVAAHPAPPDASSDPGQARAISQAFEQRFPGIEVTAVRATPMPGIFEVQVDMDLMYTDAAVDYVIQGSMIDARARRDLTAERLESLQQVAFSSLPLEHAIRQVKGTGARKIAAFEDPNCGYCKQFHRTLDEVDNVTIYTFLFPILTPDSATRSRNIWCAADPARAWKDWMHDGKEPALAECDTPIQDNLALGHKLNVQGTPTLFFADGTRVSGTLPLEALQKKLAAQGS
jgi:thiol:disulfide interchange protein DsbC